jgi:hypothetical protein
VITRQIPTISVLVDGSHPHLVCIQPVLAQVALIPETWVLVVATMVVVAVRRYARPSQPNTSTFRAGPGTRRPAAAGGPSSCPSRLGAAHAGRQRVIGGHILDSSALVAFARGTSIYAAAAVWTAVEESIVLIVPSTAVAAAWTKLDGEHYARYEVLLHLPVTVVDNLDESRARTIGQLGGPQAIACAQERGWPLLTADPAQYAAYQHTGVDLEPLI